MEVLERSLDEKRCLCGRMKEEEAKFCVNTYPGVAHGRANIGTGRASFLDVLGSIFCFFESYMDNYLRNNLKQQKTNKIKAIKCMGCLPRSAYLESLA